MEVKIAQNVMAAVEIDGELIANFDNSATYESISDNEAFFYIKNLTNNKEIKIRFLKKS